MGNVKRMKPTYPRTLALSVAAELIALLQPVTERVEVAGSVRRGKANVSDLELVLIPKRDTVPDGLFDFQTIDLAARLFDTLLDRKVLAKRPNIAGHFAWGPQNKLAIHVKTGLPVDLFSTSRAGWYRTLLIRTGPKDFNLRIIEALAKRGYKLHAYGEAALTGPDGNDVSVDSEQALFTLAGWLFQKPEERRGYES